MSSWFRFFHDNVNYWCRYIDLLFQTLSYHTTKRDSRSEPFRIESTDFCVHSPDLFVMVMWLLTFEAVLVRSWDFDDFSRFQHCWEFCFPDFLYFLLLLSRLTKEKKRFQHLGFFHLCCTILLFLVGGFRHIEKSFLYVKNISGITYARTCVDRWSRFGRFFWWIWWTMMFEVHIWFFSAHGFLQNFTFLFGRIDFERGEDEARRAERNRFLRITI